MVAHSSYCTTQSLSTGHVQVLGCPQASCGNPRNKTCKSKGCCECVCGLLPATDGYRKKGLWQKDAPVLASLGQDPAQAVREQASCVACCRLTAHRPCSHMHAQGVPGGLDNLGNLCYANSALQCLFHVTRLRAGLFAADGAQAEEGVLLEIRYVLLYLRHARGLQQWADAISCTGGCLQSCRKGGKLRLT